MLTLSLQPCTDKDECKHPGTEHAASTNPSTHHEDTETCSPLCMCACCGTPCGFISFQAQLEPSVPLVNRAIADYKSSFVKDVFFSIWQPPKLV